MIGPLGVAVFWAVLILLVSVAWYWTRTTVWPDSWMTEAERLDADERQDGAA